jgi:hypothetical protein
MDRAGVDLALFLESGGDLLRPAWNPVRLNRQGTLELRGMDSNLPEATFAAVELVLAAAGRVVREGLRVTPDEEVSTFEVDGDRVLVPGFGRLTERLFRAAVAGGTDDPTATAYVDSVLDFAGGDGPRLEKLRLRRQAKGFYPTTEGEILASQERGDEEISREEGLRLVLWACDALEGEVFPAPVSEAGPAAGT